MTTRESVLEFLENKKGGPVSGSTMAEALGITRAAVWKTIRVLQDEGYPIDAINKRGYLLRPESDILSAQAILPHIDDCEFYRDIQVFPRLASTNTTAKELAVRGAPEGTAVLADSQTAGRGRMGRSFFSPPGGGVYLSVILRPQTKVETSLLVTAAAAVAVSRAIRAVSGLETQIKWVNDIYSGGRKLCGILTEASMDFESQTLDYLVVGIGINVLDSDFPPELAAVATSLQHELGGRILSRCALAGAILNELRRVTDNLGEKRFLPEYRERSLLLGERVSVISPAATEHGTACEIDEQARLLVRMDSGELRCVSSGEVSIRKAE